MARKRLFDEEKCCTDCDLGSMSPLAQLAWWKIQFRMDDQGVCPAKPANLKSIAFAFLSEVDCAACERIADEVEAAGLWVRFHDEGTGADYWWDPTLTLGNYHLNHARIQYPSPPLEARLRKLGASDNATFEKRLKRSLAKSTKHLAKFSEMPVHEAEAELEVEVERLRSTGAPSTGIVAREHEGERQRQRFSPSEVTETRRAEPPRLPVAGFSPRVQRLLDRLLPAHLHQRNGSAWEKFEERYQGTPSDWMMDALERLELSCSHWQSLDGDPGGKYHSAIGPARDTCRARPLGGLLASVEYAPVPAIAVSRCMSRARAAYSLADPSFRLAFPSMCCGSLSGSLPDRLRLLEGA